MKVFGSDSGALLEEGLDFRLSLLGAQGSGSEMQISNMSSKAYEDIHSGKLSMDTENDGFGKGISFQTLLFCVSIIYVKFQGGNFVFIPCVSHPKKKDLGINGINDFVDSSPVNDSGSPTWKKQTASINSLYWGWSSHPK